MKSSEITDALQRGDHINLGQQYGKQAAMNQATKQPSVQIPPEPPDAAFVVVKKKRDQGRKPVVVDAFQRNDDLTLGPDKWWSLTEARALDWPTLWLENNRPGLYIYVATEFTDLYRYNRMEYPK